MSNLDRFSGAELTVAELDVVAGGGRHGHGPGPAPAPKPPLANIQIVGNINVQHGSNNHNSQSIINNSSNSGNVIYLPWY